MNVEIYLDRNCSPDKLIARIDDQGKITAFSPAGDNYLGWIDYSEGDVLDTEDNLIGWAENEGAIIKYSYFHDQETEIGFVNEDGEVFYYNQADEDVYFCQVKEIRDFAEGAAALLFFCSVIGGIESP